ncbi:MAG TPA: hypothetical protein VE175_15850, partial [Woeseiaceae bacterium]|nr:hypothetical protein [Woeseiaceae bacterium]
MDGPDTSPDRPAAASSDGEGGRRSAFTPLVFAVAMLSAAVHLYQTATYALPSGQFKNLHVGL